MMITNINNMQFNEAYGIQCAALPIAVDRDGCYATFCRIPPFGRTLPGAHYETEMFYIISGKGEMLLDGVSQLVSSGDLIHINAFSDHQLINHSATEIVFLSVYSEDSTVPALPAEVMVTAAPPTPNGPLHLGHISGPYLAADILSRYLRLRSVKVMTHTGMDDHQNYVAEAARHENADVSDYLLHMHDRIHGAFNKMSIQFDSMDYPASTESYQKHAKDFFERAKQAGVIQKEIVELPFCVPCDMVLMDGLISGNCPACGSVSSGACEVCGNVVSPELLQLSKCTRCLLPASYKRVSVYTFSLAAHLPAIKNELDALDVSQHVRDIIRYANDTPNSTIIVAYPASNAHGIQVDDAEFVLHVWFEMAANYERFSLSDTHWIHTFGFDNAFYYLMYIPALLRAMGADNRCSTFPEQVIINEFLHLDNKKLSTSKQYAIWADEFDGNSDHLRLYLSLHRPDRKTSNVDVEAYEHFSKQLTVKLEQLTQLVCPEKLTVDKKRARQSLLKSNSFVRSIEHALHPAQLDLRNASRQLMRFIDDAIHHECASDTASSVLRVIVMVMQIFMPNEAKKLSLLAGIEQVVWIKDWTPYYTV